VKHVVSKIKFIGEVIMSKLIAKFSYKKKLQLALIQIEELNRILQEQRKLIAEQREVIAGLKLKINKLEKGVN
jgi:hypothetical protein